MMPQHLRCEEFHRWAEGQTGRYERIDGKPVAMSTDHIQRVRIKSRVRAALDRAVTAAGLDCEALANGVTIEVDDDTDYEPDAVVNCGPLPPPDSVAAAIPLILVEVLSPTMRAVSSDELADYFRVASIHHYLIVNARRREIIHHQRAVDAIVPPIVNLGSIHLDPPGIAIDLAEIYVGLG
jgi:Uma2 family endonuclease